MSSRPASTYRELAPPPALATYVACLWVHQLSDGDGRYIQPVLPDGCIDIVASPTAVFVAGPATRPFTTQVEPGSTTIGIRFRPGAAPPLIGAGAAELREQAVPLDAIWGRSGMILADRLAETQGPTPADRPGEAPDGSTRPGREDRRAEEPGRDDRRGEARTDRPGEAPDGSTRPGWTDHRGEAEIDRPDEVPGSMMRPGVLQFAGVPGWAVGLAVLTDGLVERVRAAPGVDPVAIGVAALLAEEPGVSLPRLAEHAGLSERQLRRRVEDAVGYPPRMLARILRFQRFLQAWRATPEAPRDLAGLAAVTGYADQAHLTRESRRLGGLPPGALLDWETRRLAGADGRNDQDEPAVAGAR